MTKPRPKKDVIEDIAWSVLIFGGVIAWLLFCFFHPPPYNPEASQEMTTLFTWWLLFMR